MNVVTPGNFKNGLTIERDGGVWKVMSFQQSKTARQAAVVRTKLKNLVSGATVEDTFRMTETSFGPRGGRGAVGTWSVRGDEVDDDVDVPWSRGDAAATTWRVR